jgi:hypothetical protein
MRGRDTQWVISPWNYGGECLNGLRNWGVANTQTPRNHSPGLGRRLRRLGQETRDAAHSSVRPGLTDGVVIEFADESVRDNRRGSPGLEW